MVVLLLKIGARVTPWVAQTSSRDSRSAARSSSIVSSDKTKLFKLHLMRSRGRHGRLTYTAVMPGICFAGS